MDSPEIEVRAATSTDRARVVALLVAQLREHDIATPEPGVAAAVDRVLRSPDWGRILVATAAGEIVGVAALSFAWPIEAGGMTAWLEELYVEPARRGHGIGGVLLGAACRLAEECAARCIDLEIVAGHERVERLYARAGFVALPRRHWSRVLQGQQGT